MSHFEALRSAVAQNSRCYFHPLSKRRRPDASYPPMISPAHHPTTSALLWQPMDDGSPCDTTMLAWQVKPMRDNLAANAAQDGYPPPAESCMTSQTNFLTARPCVFSSANYRRAAAFTRPRLLLYYPATDARRSTETVRQAFNVEQWLMLETESTDLSWPWQVHGPTVAYVRPSGEWGCSSSYMQPHRWLAQHPRIVLPRFRASTDGTAFQSGL